MNESVLKSELYKKIIDERNIFNAIFCLESYVFEKGLLDTAKPVKLSDEIVAENDLKLYYALADKNNVIFIDKIIKICQKRLHDIFSSKDNLFELSVFFRLKNYDDNQLKFRPLHTARLTDIICMVSILNLLMFEDDFNHGKRHLSDLSKLIPHNFYGNIPSTDVQFLFHKWQTKYKEYTDNVIEHSKIYRGNHEYLTEVCLDIKNFYPSVSPFLLRSYIVSKLRHVYSNDDDLQTLKIAVTKLLFFNISEENIKPWLDYYYLDNSVNLEADVYMNCGIPQGLPQSYFFGNLCMLNIKKILMKEKYFKGDAYFYVDDSVIYINSELSEDVFKKKIYELNQDLKEKGWYLDNKMCAEEDEYLSSRYSIFQQKIDYIIQFHEGNKSVYTLIDDTYRQTDLLLYCNQQASMSSLLLWNMDELDNQISLEKLTAFNLALTNEIDKLKSGQDNSNANSSQLKHLKRIKKYFLYRQRIMTLKHDGSPQKTTKKFIKNFLDTNRTLEKWFELNDEEIFMSEYRMLIQKEALNKAIELSAEISNFEKGCLQKANVNIDNGITYLYYTKDADTSVFMKSETSDIYGSLSLWARKNMNGYQMIYEEPRIRLCRRILANKEKITKGMLTSKYDGTFFTSFILKASMEYKRRIINACFSEIIGVPLSDALTFTKTNSQKINYSELRILAYLRNKNFDFRKFKTFVDELDDKDVANRMAIDMGLLEVLNNFVIYVNNAEWVDALILTHRLTKSLWSSGSKFLYTYTLHNEEHAVTLIRKTIELVNRIDYFSLKRSDYYILFLACYLHDVSMVIHPDLKTFSSDLGDNQRLISELMMKMHTAVESFYKKDSIPNKKKRSRIQDAGQFLMTVFSSVYEYFENRIRANHAKESAKFINKRDDLLRYIEPTLRSFVASVSESHGFDIDEVYGLRSKAKDDTISLKYMMILIRLADSLDVANDRVNYYLLCQNMKHMSLVSQFHWISHLVTDKIDLRTKYKLSENKETDQKDLPINEIININIYLNFKQLTTIENKSKCKNCQYSKNKNVIEISVKSTSLSGETCKVEGDCIFLCYWMVKKHEWLIKELIALNDYLYSVNNSLIKTQIKFNIHYNDDMTLNSEMFDAIQEYLKH